MPTIQSTQSPAVLVAIDIAKLRHEVLVKHLDGKVASA